MVAAKYVIEEESSGYVKVNGAKLNYVIEGKGIPFMVLGSSKFYPKTFSKELREHLTLIFVDSRFFASSTTPFELEGISMDTFTDDVEHIRRTLDLDKIAVTGHSAHGILALEYGLKYPEHSSHVIMIGTPFWNPEHAKTREQFWEADASEERKRILKRNHERLTEKILSKLTPGEVFIKRYIANGPVWWYDPTYDSSWLWEGIKLNWEVWNHFISVIMKDYHIAHRLRRVTVPVFSALGRYDYGVPFYLWRDTNENFPILSYNLFEKSGHYPHFEESALFNRNLIDWIKSTSNMS